MKNRKYLRLCPLSLLIAFLGLGCESWDDHRRPAKIYIPEGYIGWVRIEYGVKDAPKLQTDFLGPWEYQRFPPSGLIQTSSELKDGAASAESFYYSEDGSTKPLLRNMEQGGTISWCVKKPDGSRLERAFVTYFIGSREEYEKHEHELEKFKEGDCRYVINSLDDLPKVGNISRTAER